MAKKRMFVLVITCIDFRVEGDEVEKAVNELLPNTGSHQNTTEYGIFVLPGAAAGLDPRNGMDYEETESGNGANSTRTAQKRQKIDNGITQCDLFHTSLGTYSTWKETFMGVVDHFKGKYEGQDAHITILFLDHRDCGVYKTVNRLGNGEPETHAETLGHAHAAYGVQNLLQSSGLNVIFGLMDLKGCAITLTPTDPTISEYIGPITHAEDGNVSPKKKHHAAHMHSGKAIVLGCTHTSVNNGGKMDRLMYQLGLKDQYDLITLPGAANFLMQAASAATPNLDTTWANYLVEIMNLCARLHHARRFVIVHDLDCDFECSAVTVESLPGTLNVTPAPAAGASSANRKAVIGTGQPEDSPSPEEIKYSARFLRHRRAIKDFQGNLFDGKDRTSIWNPVVVENGSEPKIELLQLSYAMTMEGYVHRTPVLRKKLEVLRTFDGNPVDCVSGLMSKDAIDWDACGAAPRPTKSAAPEPKQ